MPYPHVVLDANVIVQGRVRGLLLDAAAAKLCRVRWTEAILTEARRAAIGDLGHDPAAVDALLAALRRHFPRAAIAGYESLVDAMMNDPKDQHVAAAAAHARANVVTFNLRHFRPEHLAPFGVRALSPATPCSWDCTTRTPKRLQGSCAIRRRSGRFRLCASPRTLRRSASSSHVSLR